MQETGFDPWVGKIPWKRERLPTPYSDLENSRDYTVHGVAKSQTRLRDFHFHYLRWGRFWNELSWVHRPPQAPHCSFPRRLRECSTSWTLAHSPVSGAPELDVLYSIPRPLPYHCNSFKNTRSMNTLQGFSVSCLEWYVFVLQCNQQQGLSYFACNKCIQMQKVISQWKFPR